jgi:hypothetical protein
MSYNVNFEQFRLTFAMKCTYSHTFLTFFVNFQRIVAFLRTKSRQMGQ